MPAQTKGPEPRCNVLRPDFAGNAERCYRRGYSLLIQSLMGRRLTPEQMADARRASFTSQRLLNAALGLHGQGEFTAWCDDAAIPA